MSATYLKFGRGESIRSLQAKATGVYPKTLFKKQYSITEKQWKSIDEIHTPSEWHHTGKYANRTYFYNPEDVKMAWIENYGYETLPKGLKGVETYDIRKFKANQRVMKYGANIWSDTQKTNNHTTLQNGLTKLVRQCRFDEAGRLLKKMPKGTYISMSIETGLISMQTASKAGNISTKDTFYPSSFLGFDFYKKKSA